MIRQCSHCLARGWTLNNMNAEIVAACQSCGHHERFTDETREEFFGKLPSNADKHALCLLAELGGQGGDGGRGVTIDTVASLFESLHERGLIFYTGSGMRLVSWMRPSPPVESGP